VRCRPRRVTLATLALLLVPLAACGGDGAPTVEPGEEGDGAFDGTVDAGDADAGDRELEGVGALDAEVEAAVADLAAAEGRDPDDIRVVAAERVVWADGSLGCPDPDGMYTQALVEGYRVVLALDGDEVHYHGADGATPARCDDPQPPAEGAT
jgi:hypothetical protein